MCPGWRERGEREEERGVRTTQPQTTREHNGARSGRLDTRHNDTYCVSNTHHDHGKDDHEGESVNQEHLRSKRGILAIRKTSVIIMIYNTFI